jgi:hypothetical protein
MRLVVNRSKSKQLFEKLSANLSGVREQGVEVYDCKSDSECGRTPVDMLIGAESFAKIVTGKQTRLSHKLIVFETKLGLCAVGESGEEEESMCLMITEDQETDVQILNALEKINRIEGNDDPTDEEAVRQIVEKVVDT